MRTLLLAAASACLLAAPSAFADGGVTVPLPDVSGVSAEEARPLLARIVEANVVGSNCAAYAITDGQWTLLTGTEDLLAAKLGLDPATLDDQYYNPAFESLDDPATCDRVGPKIRGVLKTLVLMGGSTEPIPQ
jgi:hypothetical protein